MGKGCGASGRIKSTLISCVLFCVAADDESDSDAEEEQTTVSVISPGRGRGG